MARIITPIEFLEAERYITEALEAKGYIVQELGYHSYFKPQARELISQINKPTSLYIRTLPDRLAIGLNGAILIEIKDVSERDNIAIEVFPFLVGRHLGWKFGIKSLYLFFDGINITGDFAECLPIDRVILPQRPNLYQANFWLELLNEAFPTIKVERMPTKGSGDPLLIILKDKRQSLRYFEKLL